MTLRNGEAYKQSLRELRPNVHKWGERIDDVTTHPATRLHVQSVAASYDAAFDPARAPVFTATSHLTGKPAHRWNTLMRSAEDVLGNARMKRAQFHRSGTCQGATCAGWTAVNALWAVTHELDAELGTDYQGRLRDYVQRLEENGSALVGALTDAKGNRDLSTSASSHRWLPGEPSSVITDASPCGSAPARRRSLAPASPPVASRPTRWPRVRSRLPIAREAEHSGRVLARSTPRSTA
jgi:4-hydroxybutyryl-CoA dehydratase / vinylacetyl-CoA-Delta-isomerase